MDILFSPSAGKKAPVRRPSVNDNRKPERAQLSRLSVVIDALVKNIYPNSRARQIQHSPSIEIDGRDNVRQENASRHGPRTDLNGNLLMDWPNRKLVYSSVDDLNLDEKGLLARSRSNTSVLNLAGCELRPEESEIDLGDSKDTGNFRLAFDRLGLEASPDRNEEMIPPFGDRGTQTCGCQNCFENDHESIKGIKSREISTMRLVVQGPEILNYQGTQYTPEDIARYWKKDSRMWLWKSVRMARRRMIESAKSSPIHCATRIERGDVPRTD